MQYDSFVVILLKFLAITMLHTDNPIVNDENTINLKSLALKGILNILVCVEGTQPHPNISTKIRLSKIL